MNGTQILMGLVIVGGCLMGCRNERLILTETKYGSLIRKVCGERNAPTVLRILLFTGGVLGILLAANILKPIRWE